MNFHNGSNCGYHFIIKELPKKFEGKFACLGEDTEKLNTFFRSNRGRSCCNESVVTISYKIKFIDSVKFIATSLSNLVDNLTEETHKIKCKDCDCFLQYECVKQNSTKNKCTSCNKDYSNVIDEELKKRFKNSFIFSNNVNKFI